MDAPSRIAQEGNAVYEVLRPLLFSIAYRMVSSASEAEDIVQEAFLRFHRETESGNGYRVTQGMAVHSHDATCHQPRAIHARKERELRRNLAPRTDRYRLRIGGGASRRDGGLPLDGLPRPDREPRSCRAGGVPTARGIRVRLRRDCRHRKQE